MKNSAMATDVIRVVNEVATKAMGLLRRKKVEENRGDEK